MIENILKHPFFKYILAPIIVGITLFYIIKQNKNTSHNITSYNQQGGITAQNITIEKYFESPFREEKIQEEKLKQKYPFGFAIFATDEKNINIPNDLNFEQEFKFNWGTAKVNKLTPETIEITFPEIIYKPIKSTINKFTWIIPRNVGYQKSFPFGFEGQKFKPIIEVLDNQPDFVVIVVGFK